MGTARRRERGVHSARTRPRSSIRSTAARSARSPGPGLRQAGLGARRRGGSYAVQVANPYVMGVTEAVFNGEGYVVKLPYEQGALVETVDPAWVAGGRAIEPAREYRQTLEAVVNGLVDEGFRIVHLDEGTDTSPDVRAAPGTLDHFNAIVPPWLLFWAVREA